MNGLQDGGNAAEPSGGPVLLLDWWRDLPKVTPQAGETQVCSILKPQLLTITVVVSLWPPPPSSPPGNGINGLHPPQSQDPGASGAGLRCGAPRELVSWTSPTSRPSLTADPVSVLNHGVPFIMNKEEGAIPGNQHWQKAGHLEACCGVALIERDPGRHLAPASALLGLPRSEPCQPLPM